jgi:PTH2 family peptidyl-tRNA hydrolase
MNHYKNKQVLIARKDLNYTSKGKICAMMAHASVAALLNSFKEKSWNLQLTDNLTRFKLTTVCSDNTYDWINGDFAKVCLVAPTGDDLIAIYNRAKEKGLPCSLIEDNGTTAFNGVKTLTAVGIGPANSEIIDEITGNLKLL